MIFRPWPGRARVASERVERKLAAILAADVAGYSRLAGADEERTLARLRALRGDLLDPAIAAHRGRVVKRTGDGILVEFRSVVDAVRCAIEVQNGMVERGTGLAPDRRIAFRVGIHLGDVVEERDGDLMGDGVNIAARLEGIAEPGGICLSASAYDQVRDRIAVAFRDLGERQLKNIARPVRVYAAEIATHQSAPATSPPKPRRDAASERRAILVALVLALAAIAGAAWWFHLWNPGSPAPAEGERLSLIVLPFSNLSGDPRQDYLADILTDELTTYLSRIPQSFVIARNTAFTFKGKAVDVKQIGRELGVRYVLEGSAQPTESRVRVNARLIDAKSGAHVWADQFDTDRTDTLSMQDEIVTRLARVLQIQLTGLEAARLERAHPANPRAEELAMRCAANVLAYSTFRKESQQGLALCEQALQADGRNVRALSILAVRHGLIATTGLTVDRQGDLSRAEELAGRALAIDPNDDLAHVAKARALMAEGHLEEAVVEADRAITLNPVNVLAWVTVCFAHILLHEPQAAIACDEQAMRLSPRDPFLYTFQEFNGIAYVMLRQEEQAIDWYRRSVASNPDFPDPRWHLAAALALSGRDAEAHDQIARYLSLPMTRAETVAQLKAALLPPANVAMAAFREREFEALRKAGLPEK